MSETRKATVSYLPHNSGDGYGWGGGVILTIGQFAIPLGEGRAASALAEEMAARWNKIEAQHETQLYGDKAQS